MISNKKIDDSTITIYPEKTLDNNNAHEMSEAIVQAQGDGFKFIILDFSGLEFISSAGVGSILGSVEIARGAGGDIILCNASDKIRHIFEILDLCEYLTIVETDEAAVGICFEGANR
jgi:anti-anti-sigma factor